MLLPMPGSAARIRKVKLADLRGKNARRPCADGQRRATIFTLTWDVLGNPHALYVANIRRISMLHRNDEAS